MKNVKGSPLKVDEADDNNKRSKQAEPTAETTKANMSSGADATYDAYELARKMNSIPGLVDMLDASVKKITDACALTTKTLEDTNTRLIEDNKKLESTIVELRRDLHQMSQDKMDALVKGSCADGVAEQLVKRLEDKEKMMESWVMSNTLEPYTYTCPSQVAICWPDSSSACLVHRRPTRTPSWASSPV